MSQSARDRWSQKRCPFGVGDEDGKCCTSECGAWREWDTRKTKTETIERWEYERPGWFSAWRVDRVVHHPSRRETDDEGYEHWTKAYTSYLWVKIITKEVGDCGGTCGRL
jgi:hypothetical protein